MGKSEVEESLVHQGKEAESWAGSIYCLLAMVCEWQQCRFTKCAILELGTDML